MYRPVPRMGRKPELTAHQQRSVHTRLESTEPQPKFDASKLDSSSAVVTASAYRQSTLAMLAALARASRSASIGPEISSAATPPVGADVVRELQGERAAADIQHPLTN